MLGVVGTLIAGGITVYLTARAKIREDAWRRTFEEKQKAFREVLIATQKFHVVVTHACNIIESSQVHNIDRRRGHLAALVDSIFLPVAPSESTPSLRDTLQEKLAFVSGESEERQRERLLAVTRGVRNRIVLDLFDEVIKTRYTTAMARLVAYNPNVMGPLEDFIRDASNKFAEWDPASETAPNLEENWADIRQALVRNLRLDLAYSSKSFRKAVRVSKTWKRRQGALIETPNGRPPA